jgi:hypothetical protein
MKMFIRYHEAERLYSLYSDMKCMLSNLNRQLFNVSKKSDDDIYAMVMSKKISEGIQTGTTSDSTGSCALNLDTVRNKLEMELHKDISELESIIESIDSVKKVLSSQQISIIDLYYRNEIKLTWREIIRKLGITLSIRQAQNIRNSAIEKLSKLSRITVDQFTWTIKLIEGDECPDD